MNIFIREAHTEDGKAIGKLIYDTVRTINLKDYTHAQVAAWAPDEQIFSIYDESYAYVALKEEEIVGFGNMTAEGYLHRFYVHKDHQGKGVGSKLLYTLEARAKELGLSSIKTEASITARPFFLLKGWSVEKEQVVSFRGNSFINYKMSKKI